MSRSGALLAFLVAAGVLAGCGSATDPRWAAPPASPSPSPSSSPSPTPAPPLKPGSAAEIKEQVNRATVVLTADFHPETVEHTKDEVERYSLDLLCKKPGTGASNRQTAGRQRVWSAKSIWVGNYVAGFRQSVGKKHLDEIRKSVATCKTYKGWEGYEMRVLGPMEFDLPAGVDGGLAFCLRIGGESATHQCNAVLVRGHLVSELRASEVKGHRRHPPRRPGPPTPTHPLGRRRARKRDLTLP